MLAYWSDCSCGLNQRETAVELLQLCNCFMKPKLNAIEDLKSKAQTDCCYEVVR